MEKHQTNAVFQSEPLSKDLTFLLCYRCSRLSVDKD